MNNPISSEFNINQIGQIAIPVGNLERAVIFYRDVLGMRFLFQASPGLAFFDCGGIRLMLDVPAKQQQDHYGSIIYYKVENLPSACETLKARGVHLEQEPDFVAQMPDHELWMAFLRDPDGNMLGLMWEKR
ncbi:MAG: VOC family protein [Anaerolineaceae bacterium]|nr:VOC family protein [Anaerolineaceae bacterium]